MRFKNQFLLCHELVPYHVKIFFILLLLDEKSPGYKNLRMLSRLIFACWKYFTKCHEFRV